MLAMVPGAGKSTLAQSTDRNSASQPAFRQNASQNRTQTARVRPQISRPPPVNISRPPPRDISRPPRTGISRMPSIGVTGQTPANGASNDSSVNTVTTPRPHRVMRPGAAVRQQTGAQTPPAAVDQAQTPPEGNEPPKTAARVNVTVLSIIATNKDNRTDPALQNLAEQLKPTFKFSGYRLVRTDTRTVPTGQTARIRLVGSYGLQVTPTQADAQYVAMNVQALRVSRRVLGLQLRLRPGTYQLLGGWPVSGDTLLAAVTAMPAD
jgi:hypothetical protein